MKFPLNIRIVGGPTALTVAAQLGHFEIVKMLIEAGANINKLSVDGDGPLYKAIEQGHTEIAHYLVENKAKMVLSAKYRDKSPLFLVIKTQNVEMLQKFKKFDVDLTTKTSAGLSPLQYAANLGLTTIMIYLIKRMPNLDQEDDVGFTIFSRYLLMEKLEICQKLLDSGCRIDHININGKTPLHLAIECRKIKAVEFCLEKGANPHIEDFYGEDVCQKFQKYNISLSDDAIIPLLQCRPDRRIKIDPAKVEEDHKEEENKDVDDDSSDDSAKVDELGDQESMAYENQTSSSESHTESNSEMMMTGSSFFVSDMGPPSPSRKSKFYDDVENSEKFIQKLREADESSEGNKVNIRRPEKKSTVKLLNNDSSKDVQPKINIEKTKEAESSNPVSEKDASMLMSPDRINLRESQISLQSQVSNPFKIQIIEQTENDDIINQKSRNSSLQASVEKKKEEETAGNNATQAQSANPDEAKAEDTTPKPKKKKKKKKKAKNHGEGDDQTEHNVTDIGKPDGAGPKSEDPKPSEEAKEPQEVTPREKVELQGIHVEKPLNLDKLLLSNQTDGNGAFSKIKKKKKKKKKGKTNEEDTSQPMETQEDDKTEDRSNHTPDIPTSSASKDLGDTKRQPKKPGSGKTDSTVLAGSVQSGGNNKFGIYTSDAVSKGSDSGKAKTLEEMSGRKELGKLKGDPRKRGTPHNGSSKASHNTSVMDGGDMDVKEYMKTIKQIEQEKDQYKREKMSGSLGSNGSAKIAKNGRYS